MSLDKGEHKPATNKDQSARFPGNITQTQKFLRIFGGARGVFAFQCASSERSGKALSSLLSHWRARTMAVNRQGPGRSLVKRKGTAGKF